MGRFLAEFKKFAIRGNMVDLAIGVVIGAAFNKVVDVLVKQIVMPPLGYLTSGTDFSDLSWEIKAAVMEGGQEVSPRIAIGYGAFMGALLDFFIIALTIFVVVKAVNRLRQRAEDETDKAVATPKDIQLLADIRDEMRAMREDMKKG